MDVSNALHRWKNAIHAHSLTIELLMTLKRGFHQEINQARTMENEAWKRLSAARKEIKEAILEGLGE